MFLINNNNFRTKNEINPAYYNFLMFNKRNCVPNFKKLEYDEYLDYSKFKKAK